jgi:hypothetical protein
MLRRTVIAIFSSSRNSAGPTYGEYSGASPQAKAYILGCSPKVHKKFAIARNDHYY